MVEQTVLLNNCESKRKTLEVEAEAYQVINSLANSGNKTASQGTMTYELVRMHERGGIMDALDEQERFIDDCLDDAVCTGFSDVVDRIKLQRESVGDSFAAMEVFDKYDEAMSGDDKEDLCIRIPVVMDEKHGWGFNRLVSMAAREYLDTPFRDRADRLKCKQELYLFAVESTEPTHDVSDAVVTGESDRLDVSEAHEVLTDELTDWWHRDDLTWDDVRDKQDGPNNLTTHQREQRIRVIKTCWDTDGGLSREVTKRRIQKAFSVSEPTAVDYLKDLKRDYGIRFRNPSRDDVTDEDIDIEEDITIAKIPQAEGYNMAEMAHVLDASFGNMTDNKVNLKPLAKLMFLAGWIEDEDEREAGKLVQDLNAEYELENYRKLQTGTVYVE